MPLPLATPLSSSLPAQTEADLATATSWVATESDAGQRLDRYLVDQLGHRFSRCHLQKAITTGKIQLNGQAVFRNRWPLKPGDVISLAADLEQRDATVDLQIPNLPVPASNGAKSRIEILYDDADIAVINKPRGMTVHPGTSTGNDTLVHALVAIYQDNLAHRHTDRPGIVHRLDRDTSGLLLIAKHNRAHAILSQQLRLRQIQRQYLAVVHGVTGLTGTVDQAIARRRSQPQLMCVVSHGGRPAITHYTTLATQNGLSLVRCTLETGRTHQIRVHMSWLNHPLVGDRSYGRGFNLHSTLPPEVRQSCQELSGQALHAYRLAFTHPITGEPLAFTALPEGNMAVLCEFFGDKKIPLANSFGK